MEVLSRRAFMLLNMGLIFKPQISLSMPIKLASVENNAFVCSTVSLAEDTPSLATGRPSNTAIANNSAEEFKISPFGVATAKKKWGFDRGLTPDTGIVTLGVHFLNGSSEMHAEVERRAKLWIDERLSRKLKFQFNVCSERSQIRILFNNEKNESVLGSDAERAKYESSPTMWIKDLRSVTHEFGHALCLRHEHRHSEFPYEFHEDIVIADMKEKGWKPADTRRNILNKIAKSECLGDTEFNRESVMLYEIPDHWLRVGQALNPNRDVSQRDRNCVYALYEA